MHWQYSPYVVVLILAAGLSALLAWPALRQRDVPGSRTFAWLMIAATEWALATAAETAAVGMPAKLFWAKLEHLGSDVCPTLFLIFALQYTYQTRWLTRRNLALLWLIPVSSILMAATNEWHGLTWPSFTPGPEGSNILIFHHGVWFWFTLSYFYLSILTGILILIRFTLRSPTLYRRQAATLVIGSLIPIITSALYVFGLNPFPGLDISPISLILTGLVIAFGIFRFRLFDVVPLARDAMIESMGDGVIVLDAQNRVVDINPAARQLIGAADRSLIGQHAQVLTARSDAWAKPVQALIERPLGELEANVELALELGSSRYIDFHISPVYDRNKHASGRLIVLHDVSARKQAEIALQQYASELETRNAELDAFAHTVAHDLKNPVAAIVGYGALLEARYGSMTDEKRQEMVHIIIRNGHRMANIIDELLLLASIRKMGEIESSPLNMGEIVAEARDRLAMLIEEQQAEVSIPEQWPTALGHAAWVEEVWVNYISNAAKYGGQPSKIELGADAGSKPSAAQRPAYVRFWVRDNGPGLAAEEQKRLFTPFIRLEKTRASGHGLGLSIVQRIVDKLGGQAGVDSQPGQGSTFWFTLRAATENPE